MKEMKETVKQSLLIRPPCLQASFIPHFNKVRSTTKQTTNEKSEWINELPKYYNKRSEKKGDSKYRSLWKASLWHWRDTNSTSTATVTATFTTAKSLKTIMKAWKVNMCERIVSVNNKMLCVRWKNDQLLIFPNVWTQFHVRNGNFKEHSME